MNPPHLTPHHSLSCPLCLPHRITLGDFDFEAIKSNNKFLGPPLFVSYIFLVVFVMMSMFIAILDSSYGKIKSAKVENEEARRCRHRIYIDWCGRPHPVKPTLSAVFRPPHHEPHTHKERELTLFFARWNFVAFVGGKHGKRIRDRRKRRFAKKHREPWDYGRKVKVSMIVSDDEEEEGGDEELGGMMAKRDAEGGSMSGSPYTPMVVKKLSHRSGLKLGAEEYRETHHDSSYFDHTPSDSDDSAASDGMEEVGNRV